MTTGAASSRPPGAESPPLHRPPELLAPASNLEAALVAFDAGADSVYAGLPRFNARERGDNFSLDDFAALVSHGRSIDRKVYLTLNTLVKESELPDVADMLGDVADIRPHAVIVQDLGILRILRRCFPDLAVHASTQMGIHNSAGVRLAASMGIERVILERQLTLDEVRATIAASPIEVEVFAHGALCCSLSGSCLFSSWIGGWSGNRGRCKQPCRRRFFASDGNGFFFSTKDLYTLDLITAFEEAGVTAIKIEGRLRQADYVQSVVGAYRRILDTPPADRRGILKEARKDLSASFGRKWAHGFLDDERPKDVIQHQSLGVSGQLCGDVTATARGGFSLRLSRPVQLGDRIRIQPLSGDEGPSITITRLAVDRRSVQRASPGRSVFVSCDKAISSGDRVFKIGRRTKGKTPILDRKRRRPLRADFQINADGFTAALQGLEESWHRPEPLAKAQRRPLSTDQVRSELGKCRDDEWELIAAKIKVADGLFLQQRDLRRARQAFWAWVLEQVRRNPPPTPGETGRSAFTELMAAAPNLDPIDLETVVFLKEGQKNPVARSIAGRTVAEVASMATAGGKRDRLHPSNLEIILPPFCPEPALPALHKAVASLVKRGLRRFRATSLYGLELLRSLAREHSVADSSLRITAGFPIPTANSLALHQLLEVGAQRATIWIELEEAAAMALASAGKGRLEVFTRGRPPLLLTRAQLAHDGPIRDGRGLPFRVLREENLTLVLPEKVLTLPDLPHCGRFLDLRRASLNEEGACLNYDHDWR